VLGIDYPSERWEVIVVDDGSGDHTADAVAESCPPARYLEQPNRGAAAARNLGARQAKFDFLVFLDDDMLVRPDHLLRHEEAHHRFGPCVANGHWQFETELLRQLEATAFGRFRLHTEAWVKEGLAHEPIDDRYSAPVSVTACNLSVSRADFWRAGGFDETFAAAGAEDQEFSVRARRAGLRFVYSRDIVLEHNDGRVTFRQFCRRQRQGARSARVLASKHPEEFGQTPLMTENGRVRRADPAPVKAKKVVKRVLSSRAPLAGLHASIDLAARVRPDSPLLQRAYRAATGLYIYRGVRDQE
jgi:GT2 family glycosyltransferase